jgi:hypothetical protein
MRMSVLWVVLAILVSVQRADADDADTVASKKADALFDEGKALFETDLDKACQKFEESLSYNSQAIGTLLNVALCDEKRGRIASAVARFTDARERAKEGGLAAHQKAAEEHIAALTPKIPYVTLKFTEAPSADTTIVIDDKVVSPSARENLPIDPGDHTVKVSAPGRLPYQTTFKIAQSAHQDVSIPRLEKSVTVKSSRQTIGKITTVTGVAALTTGIVLGVIANRKYDNQFTTHPDPTPEQMINGVTPPSFCTKLPNQKSQCDAEGFAATKSAITIGNVGTVVGIVGVAAVGVGVYLWLRPPSESGERQISFVPQVGPDGTGVAAVGRF